MRIPFNKPYLTGRELAYISEAHAAGQLSGHGPFTRRCQAWFEERLGAARVLLTHSGTAALEMAALLAEVGPGDEVIMPSFTFTSTANAFVLRGATPVFVDIRPDTLNLDEAAIEAAITPRTKAIVPVHYAGVSCEMEAILEIAERRGLLVIEDAAHGVMAEYRGRPLGGLGHLAAFSFHETKNVICGEGGALVVNDPRFAERAEILWEKGTNRCQFARGEIDKYTWVDLGSSYPPSELAAAFLWAQLEQAREITDRRLEVWLHYHSRLVDLAERGLVRVPSVPAHCAHNAHLYYLLAPCRESRTELLAALKQAGIGAVFHYVPLHASPAGRRYGRAHGALTHTVDLAARLVRLPLWVGLPESQIAEIAAAIGAVAHRWAANVSPRFSRPPVAAARPAILAAESPPNPRHAA